VDFHRFVASGLSPEAALAATRLAAHRSGDGIQIAASQSFVVIRGASGQSAQ
jgi:hypothetical protein